MMWKIGKVLAILLVIVAFAIFLRLFGFQILNHIYHTGSAPPQDLNQRCINYIIIMFIASLIALRQKIFR